MTRNNATARRAGYDAEADLVAYLQHEGAPHAERRVAGSARDRGDVAGVPGVVFQAKAPGAGQPLAFPRWMDETMEQRDHDGAAIGLLVVRRRLKTWPGDWLWTTNGTTMTGLLRAAGWLGVKP